MNCPFVQSSLNVFTALISLLDEPVNPKLLMFIQATLQ
jgi:hypothetical protein